jgi:copper oxidase (laccase) domain-containing protein
VAQKNQIEVAPASIFNRFNDSYFSHRKEKGKTGRMIAFN